MFKFFETLFKKEATGILLLAGVVLVLSSFVTSDSAQPKLLLAASPNLWRLGAGVALIVASVVGHLWVERSGSWVRRHKVESLKDGFAATFSKNGRRQRIEIVFGQIQDQNAVSVVLPVNESFERDCFSRDNTAAGAFVLRHFSGARFDEFVRAVDVAVAAAVPTPKQVPISSGGTKPSYGIGTTIEVRPPNYASPRIIATAVTAHEGAGGVRSELRYLYHAVSRVNALMADASIHAVAVPLFGTGKGGIRPELALLTLVVAFAEAMFGLTGHAIECVRIVVFQGAHGEPMIPKRVARRILAYGAGIFDG